MRSWVLVIAFLLSIAAANLAVAHWGQVALVVTAWVVIPFDMLTRDLLHERWQGDRLVLRLAGLVVAGAAIAVAVSPSSLRVSSASCASFAASMAVNAAVFHAMLARSRFSRMNASNLLAAIVDSILFPLLAFGELELALSAAQAGSKFAGGVAWTTLVLCRRDDRPKQDNGHTPH